MTDAEFEVFPGGTLLEMETNGYKTVLEAKCTLHRRL